MPYVQGVFVYIAYHGQGSHLKEDMVISCHSKVMGVEEAVLHDKACRSKFCFVRPILCDFNGHVGISKRLQHAVHQHKAALKITGST